VIVLDTTCEPLLRYWHKLTLHSACRIVRPQQMTSVQAPAASAPRGEGSFAEQRTSAVARQVILEGAHFGLWISGDGETCRLVDERGEPVAAERVLLLLTEYIGRGQETLSITLAADQAIELESRLAPLDLQCSTAGNSRQQIAEQMQHSATQLGSDGRGRYWYPGNGTPDALATLCLLLSLLSESDRPLSEVLDAGAAAK
jgi:phosphomannomutase